MDIKLVFKKTAVYSLAAGLLTALFAVLVMTITNLFSAFANVSSLKISIFAAILIAILFNPLRNRIQTFIDKIFYKKSYDYYAIIQQVSSTLASMFDMKNIVQFTGNVAYEAMGLKNIYLLTAEGGSAFDISYSLSSKKDKSRKNTEPAREDEIKTVKCPEVVRFFNSSDDILIKDEMPGHEELIGVGRIEKIKIELDLLQGEAVVPVYIDNKLMFLIVLGGKISGDMFTDEDINLLKTISDQMAIAVKNANLYKEKLHTEKLASIGMMSATFAHEVRNPLTSLKTFVQLMPEKYNDPEFRDTFSKIVEGEIEKIDGLIGDLLDFSTEKKTSRINNFNLVALVDETVDYVKNKYEFQKKNIAMDKKYNEDEINMSGDAAKLKQAFVNVITNGCQAMNGDGLLKVEISQNGKKVDVAITDTGEGISQDNIAKIFDPFVTTKEMGVGLGLAISKRIIEDHQGIISVKSRLSKGSTFTISLPVQNE